MTLLVRANGDPKSLTAAVRHEVQTLDPNLPPFNVVTLSENIDISLFPARFGALLLGGFGVLALVLATGYLWRDELAALKVNTTDRDPNGARRQSRWC